MLVVLCNLFILAASQSLITTGQWHPNDQADDLANDGFEGDGAEINKMLCCCRYKPEFQLLFVLNGEFY